MRHIKSLKFQSRTRLKNYTQLINSNDTNPKNSITGQNNLEAKKYSLKKASKSTDTTSKNVVNLSKYFRPTQAQIPLLNKGLSFILTIKIHRGQKAQMLLDIQSYRRLKLAAYFEGKKEKNSFHLRLTLIGLLN